MGFLAATVDGQPPPQINVSPINQPNLDPTHRLEFSGGHVTTFTVQHFSQGTTADVQVVFSCNPSGSVAQTTCPAPVWLAPNDQVTVSVTLTMGAAGGAGWVTLTASEGISGVGATGSTGRRDFTVDPAVATWTPSAWTDTLARGQGRLRTFRLQNTGTLPTTFGFADVASACPISLTACSRTPAATGLLQVSDTQSVTVAYAGGGAGATTLNVSATVGTRTVVTAPITAVVVDASVAAAPLSVTFAAGVTGATYTGFTVTNSPGGPGATYEWSCPTASA